MAKTVSALLAVAAGEVGYSRWTDPQQGTKYGRWYAALTHSPYFGTNGVHYCAMFASWCLAQLGISACGCPTAACTSGLLRAARSAGKLKPASQGKAGDLVLFSWVQGGYGAAEADHVGFVVSNGSGSMDTIEGNVGGNVVRRNRSHAFVVGCITPDYSGEPAPKPSGLDVDGYLGPASVTAWQKALGTYADGVISGQDPVNKEYLYRLTSVTWNYGGSPLVKAIQRKVGAGVDGYFGPETVKRMQFWLNAQGQGIVVDGYLGPKTAMAVQRTLNAGKWK